MPKISEDQVAARRSQILIAACRCLARNGFQKATIREICREAGLSTGAVYGYFKSKDEIVEALAELGRDNTRALLGIGKDATRLPSLAQLLVRAVRFAESEASRESTRLDVRLWGEALHTPQLHRLFLDALANLTEPFADSVRAAQRRGEIAAGLEPHAAARVALAIALGFEVQRAMEPDADLSGCAAVVAALFEGSFVPGKSAG